MAQGHSVDEYLETIYFLAFPIGEYRPQSTGSPTLASRVAEMLGVSRASAGEMLKRLEAEGLIERGEQKEAILTKTGRARAEKVVRKHRIIERLLTDFMGYTAAEAHVHADELGDTFSDEMVERGEHKEAILTETGRERAERVVRRHRIIERLLTDFMGYTAAEAHVHADELGDTFTDDMIERMDEKLGRPERCPHGWPVDTELEQRENRELTPLSALEEGDRATIVRLAEHDGELLHWFYDQGLVPGTKLEVTSAQPAAGQVTVRLNGEGTRLGDRINPVTKTVFIGEKAAGGLFVRPA